MAKKDIHEGEIEILIRCDNPEDTRHQIGDYIDLELLEKYGLKPGDRVLYRITKNHDIEIIAKINIEKTMEKLN